MMSIDRFFLFFNTVRFLKLNQIYFRLFYWIRKKLHRMMGFTSPLSVTSKSYFLHLSPSIILPVSYTDDTYTFLYLEHGFDVKIDWNYSKYGKLWTYNLTYFDYLHQADMTKEVGLMLVKDFIEQSAAIKDGFMPFPISLRGINWIKFLTKHKIIDSKIDDSLYAQYFRLMDNIEYHILGNHLLENGFSLLYGAYYFQDEKFYAKAKKILINELEEQILKDGAHFELSPMYHQIMLFRVLDCINLLQNNNWKDHELLDLLIIKAEVMLGWLNTITYENGDIPLLNDSTNNIAPTTKELNSYASSLNVKTKKPDLNDSGYRKIKNERYEMIIDVGNIGPDYIPGHAHSDTFNFELYINGKQFIVDTGLSTYENNERRTLERSTTSHNTVEVNGTNQSEVWGGFRVARRAKIVYLKEDKNSIEATHNGYKRIGVSHMRKFITHEDSIVIKDSIDSLGSYPAIAYLHFYPELLPKIKGNKIIINDIEIKLNNAKNIEIDIYEYSPQFNKCITAYKAKILFTEFLKMEIKL